MPRLATALALLGILAFAVFGCGGGGSDTTSSSTDGGSSSTTTTGQGSSTDTADKEGGSGSGSKEKKGGDSEEGGGGSSSEGPHGPGLAEKAKPDTKGFKAPPGGDNSIQTFGGEAESSEEKEITTAMASFLRAMAARDYNAICDGLSEANIGQLEQLMKLKKEVGTDCPTVLKNTPRRPHRRSSESGRRNRLPGPRRRRKRLRHVHPGRRHRLLLRDETRPRRLEVDLALLGDAVQPGGA